MLLAALTVLLAGVPNGRVVEAEVACAGLAGNPLGDSPRRRVRIYLPADFDRRADERFPTVYILHAFGGRPEDWLGGPGGYEGLDVAAVLDRGIADGTLPAMLAVMPDASNLFRGSWYVRSEATGDWTDCIAGSFVDEMTARFRALPEGAARGITGQSMGGYGALRLALDRPGAFGAVLAMSAPVIGESNPFGSAAVEAALAVPDRAAFAGASVPALLTLSKAAAFAPSSQSPFFGDLPFVRRQGRLEEEAAVRSRWQAATLLRQVERNVAGLRGIHVRLEVGDEDPMVAAHRQLSARLLELGVPHELEVFPGDHSKGVRRRFEESVFRFFAASFAHGQSGPRVVIPTP